LLILHDVYLSYNGKKKSRSRGRKEAQNAQRNPFFFASLARFYGKYFFI
jgi:hypothetical protein